MQGSGVLGCGILYDLAGDDGYRALDFSQGTGYMGWGLLWDCDGNDMYQARRMVQAAGLMGIGMLKDDAGHDRYECEFMGQAFGSTAGLGILNDRSGDDLYRADPEQFSFAQGSGCGCRSYPWFNDFAMYGGCGILADKAGDDRYFSGSFSQGASYFLSLGVLLDDCGNDTYDARGSYSHGGGVHLTSGFCLDSSGDDIYTGQWAGTAAGNDRSAGLFIDLSGNDRYYALDGDGLAYSHKPHGLSIFIDSSGSDVYDSPDYSAAYVLPPMTPNNWSRAVFLDCGGEDAYSLEDRENNSKWHLQPTAFGFDGEVAEPDPIKWYENLGGTGALSWFECSDSVCDALELLRMTRSLVTEPESLKRLLRKGMAAADTATQSAAMEAAGDLLIGKSKELNGTDLSALLNHPRKDVRSWTVMTLDIEKCVDAGEAVRKAIPEEDDPYVRKLMIRALGNLKPDNARKFLKHRFKDETDSLCRAWSVRSVGAYEHPDDVEWLTGCLQDDNSFTRMMAAASLDFASDNEVKAALKSAAETGDPYVLKTAGETLLKLGVRDGARYLIEYISYRALDTSSDNYGSNIGAVIAEYTNVDFSRDYDAWVEWFDTHGASFELAANLTAREAWLEAKKAERAGHRDEAMTAYESALAANPGYIKARTDYAALLNTIAWNMVTVPETGTDTAEGLKLAQRCVELDAQAMYLDTLAEAYFRNSRYEKAVEVQKQAVEKAPDEKTYRDRLEKFIAAMTE